MTAAVVAVASAVRDLLPSAAVIGVTIAQSPVVPAWAGLLATPLLLHLVT